MQEMDIIGMKTLWTKLYKSLAVRIGFLRIVRLLNVCDNFEVGNIYKKRHIDFT
jgi:hypothetical protein